MCIGLRRAPRSFRCSVCVPVPTEPKEPVAPSTSTSTDVPTIPLDAAVTHVYRIIPTEGDGRCFFRSIAIARDATLLTASRNRYGKLDDPILYLREKTSADALRASTVDYMMRNFDHYSLLPDIAANADMGDVQRYASFQDRIASMASETELPGEPEIVALTQALEQPLVIISGDDTLRFGQEFKEKTAITLRYTRYEDAGHYDLLVID